MEWELDALCADSQGLSERHSVHRSYAAGSPVIIEAATMHVAADRSRHASWRWVAGVYPAGWNESTGGQQNIGIPESVVDRCDHLAPTLLR